MYAGKWSDSDREGWHSHPDVAEALAFSPAPDGTWWMAYDDWFDNFDLLFISPVDMASFSPTPPECNTNWGATVLHPYGASPEELPREPDATQTDRCSFC